jgi:hypothetical protein
MALPLLPVTTKETMTSCDRCVQLLLGYAAAGNQVIELKQRPNPPSALLACAMTMQAQARRLLIQYHRDHACDDHCPNNCRASEKPQPRMPGSVGDRGLASGIASPGAGNFQRG